jgi:[ribosomal protein S5]-alanine N-acetyltransferase
MLILPDDFQTARLKPRPIVAGNGDAIFQAYAQDLEVVRFLTWRPHSSREDTNAYISHCIDTPPAIGRTYVLTGRDDGMIRGAFDLRRPASHRLEFGYVLARRWWGQGLMTETLTGIVHWALGQEDIFRIGAVCDVENIGSARVMEKSGLIREGLLRRWMVAPNIGDEPRDCFSYAIVR